MVASSTLSPARMSGTELRRENVFTVCDILSSEYLDPKPWMEQGEGGALVPPLPTAIPGTRSSLAPHIPQLTCTTSSREKKCRTKHAP